MMPVSHGPSRVEIIPGGLKMGSVRKIFPPTEKDRLLKEVEKMHALRSLGRTSGLFRVPLVLSVEDSSYTMSYIPGAQELDKVYQKVPPDILARKLVDIVIYLQHALIPGNSLWTPSETSLFTAMVNKFQQGIPAAGEFLEYIEAVHVLETLSRPFFPLGYCHGDLTFDNTLVDSEGVLYLIDPVWSPVESPLWDTGKLLQSVVANWAGIKRTGVHFVDPVLGPIRKELVTILSRLFHPKDLLLSLACQLARVGRWSSPKVLYPMAAQFLWLYLEENDDDCFAALCGDL